ncbi:MAG: sigma-70 family RNA polymerase sigma factor [Deltaproteobacteria bacterium]|nr:MAG: sigma-70 family RNA polymerase sigma factor [Deltaproteobacteria bacterium]
MTTVDKQQKSDWELVQEVVQNRNDEAFRVLYRRFSPEILRRLYRMLNDKEMAPDALQQVFLEAYRFLDSYRGDSRFGSWLHRIAERVVYSHNHKNKQTYSLMERWGQLIKAIGCTKVAQDPEKDVFRQELVEGIEECLQQLTPTKRETILQCDLEGKTYDELAENMNVSAGTIASRLHHARKELRYLLTQYLQSHNLHLEEYFQTA